MKIQRILLTALFCGALMSYAQDPPVKPDNTKVNKQDRNAGQPTADQQKMNKADRELAQKIRQSVIADKSLSTYAHNVKIVAQDGRVTLKGPVRNQAEKEAIEKKALAEAGKGNVVDQLDIAPDKQ